MLYTDTDVHSNSGPAFRFESSRGIEDRHILTDTHEKSNNWNEVEDGIWDQLVLNEM